MMWIIKLAKAQAKYSPSFDHDSLISNGQDDDHVRSRLIPLLATNATEATRDPC